jgi:hypothetical protein
MPALADGIESLNLSPGSQHSCARYNNRLGIRDDYNDMSELVHGNESLNPAIHGQHNHTIMRSVLGVHRSSQRTSGRVIELDDDDSDIAPLVHDNEGFHPLTQS